MKRVLFLCTGNSCRSQMAEGLVNHFMGDSWQAMSAGTFPTGAVHPLALKVLAELAIPTEDLVSKSVDVIRDEAFDVVVTVCDDAQENCPLWLGAGQFLHISFPDPAIATGTEVEKLKVFKRVRNDIRSNIFPFLRSLYP